MPQTGEAMAVARRRGVEAAAVIADFEREMSRVHGEADRDLDGPGMTKDVVQHFLQREHQVALDVERRRGVEADDLEAAFVAIHQLPAGGVQPVGQLPRIVGAGLNQPDEIADGRGGFAGEASHHFRLLRPDAGRLLPSQVREEGDAGQIAANLVVEIAGDLPLQREDDSGLCATSAVVNQQDPRHHRPQRGSQQPSRGPQQGRLQGDEPRFGGLDLL